MSYILNEYKYFLYTLYAMELSVNPKVRNFEIRKIEKDQNIILKVELSDGYKYVLMFSLECDHFEENITKYVPKEDKIKKKIEYVFVILYTDKKSVTIENTFVPLRENSEKKISIPEFLQIMLAKTQSSPNFYESQHQPKILLCYFFNHLYDTESLRSELDELINKYLDYNVADNFVYFIRKSLLGNFCLTKDKVLKKLTELSLSPWMPTTFGKTRLPKYDLFMDAANHFDITIVSCLSETSKKLVWPKIWPDLPELSDEVEKNAKEYALLPKQKTRLLWYANKIPLIVGVNEENKKLINKVVELNANQKRKMRLMLIGNVENIHLPKDNRFESLADLKEKKVIESFLFDSVDDYKKTEEEMLENFDTYMIFSRILAETTREIVVKTPSNTKQVQFQTKKEVAEREIIHKRSDIQAEVLGEMEEGADRVKIATQQFLQEAKVIEDQEKIPEEAKVVEDQKKTSLQLSEEDLVELRKVFDIITDEEKAPLVDLSTLTTTIVSVFMLPRRLIGRFQKKTKHTP